MPIKIALNFVNRKTASFNVRELPPKELNENTISELVTETDKNETIEHTIAIGDGIEIMPAVINTNNENQVEEISIIDTNQNQVEEVNSRMKEVLSQIGKFDKVCCDLLCIGLMVGLIIVIVMLHVSCYYYVCYVIGSEIYLKLKLKKEHNLHKKWCLLSS